MTLTGAYIVKLDNGSVSGITPRACAGKPLMRAGRAQDEVCGTLGLHDVGGIWLCLAHYKMFIREAGLHALADEERAVRPGTCIFPAWGASESMPAVALVCGRDAVASIGSAGVCEHHLEMATSWVVDREKAIDAEKRARVASLREAEMQTWAAQGSQVVYYLRRPSDGAIKIGTSKGFAKRHRDLSRSEVHRGTGGVPRRDHSGDAAPAARGGVGHMLTAHANYHVSRRGGFLTAASENLPGPRRALRRPRPRPAVARRACGAVPRSRPGNSGSGPRRT